MKAYRYWLEDGVRRIDQHVGAQMRRRRKELGFTQERLAEAVGVTFQQVQKYERAANRVSASMLWQIAKALETEPNFFFDGLDPGEAERSLAASLTSMTSPEWPELLALLIRVGAPARQRMLELLKALTRP